MCLEQERIAEEEIKRIVNKAFCPSEIGHLGGYEKAFEVLIEEELEKEFLIAKEIGCF